MMDLIWDHPRRRRRRYLIRCQSCSLPYPWRPSLGLSSYVCWTPDQGYLCEPCLILRMLARREEVLETSARTYVQTYIQTYVSDEIR